MCQPTESYFGWTKYFGLDISDGDYVTDQIVEYKVAINFEPVDEKATENETESIQHLDFEESQGNNETLSAQDDTTTNDHDSGSD